MTRFPETPSLPTAVFWDWDGTIVDSYEFLNGVYNYVRTSLGLSPLKEGVFRNYFGKVPKNETFKAFFGDKTGQAFELYRQYSLENNHKIKPFEGVRKTLKTLSDQNIQMGIVTIKKRELVRSELDNTGLKAFFPTVIGAGDAFKDKPNPEPILKAISNAGLDTKKHKIWYLGDTSADALCAQKAGVSFVLKRGHIDTQEIIDEFDPLFSFDNYDELDNYLKYICTHEQEDQHDFS